VLEQIRALRRLKVWFDDIRRFKPPHRDGRRSSVANVAEGWRGLETLEPRLLLSASWHDQDDSAFADAHLTLDLFDTSAAVWAQSAQWEEADAIALQSNGPLTWWVFSDAHVGHQNYDDNLSIAVADVLALGLTDFAVALGDNVDDRVREGFANNTPAERWEIFEATMNLLPHDWTYVLGNHDINSQTPPVTSVAPPNYFSTIVNGVRIIGLTDEHTSKLYVRELEMSQAQIKWFLAEMASDPVIPTIIMSHQHRYDDFPFLYNWIEQNAENYNIVLTVGGHTHEWSINSDPRGFYDIVLNPVLYHESAFMTITNLGDTSEISFQFRNHQNQEWITVQGFEVFSFQVEPLKLAPIISTTPGATNYTEKQPGVAIDPLLTIIDTDSTHLAGAVIRITGSFLPNQDVLQFTNQNGISGSYNSATGVMTLSGEATVAEYQSALRSVSYRNSSDHPSITPRTITFTVTDGDDKTSLPATKTVTLTAVNDAPVIDAPGDQAVNEDADLVFSSINGNAIVISDVDAGITAIKVTLTAVNGQLTLATTHGLLLVNDGNGTGSVTFAGNLVNVNAALDGLRFRGEANFHGAVSLIIDVDDQGALLVGGPQTAQETVNITIHPVNDAPTLGMVQPLTGAQVNTPFEITYAMLLEASDAVDVDGDLVRFRVNSLSSGTLTKNGQSVTVGDTGTLLGPGESLIWTAEPDAVGALDAFTVMAWDGQLHSSGAVQVQIANRPFADAYESDDRRRQASVIAIDGTPQVRSIHTPTDVDWVKFNIKQPGDVAIWTDGVEGGDTLITLYRRRPNGGLNMIAIDNASGQDNYSSILRHLKRGTYFLKVEQNGQTDTIAQYQLHVDATGQPFISLADEYEPNNRRAQATLITTNNVPQFHNFHVANDVDWIYFTLPTRSLVTISVNADAHSDLSLRLFRNQNLRSRPALNGQTLLLQKGKYFLRVQQNTPHHIVTNYEISVNAASPA